jgi:hypothetical protein
VVDRGDSSSIAERGSEVLDLPRRDVDRHPVAKECPGSIRPWCGRCCGTVSCARCTACSRRESPWKSIGRSRRIKRGQPSRPAFRA